ncbi:nuclear transcription factor Y subunit B-3-like [Lathyrus oleraceus]|uniref:nuclear transcription factor Y subunit B-3-like n=1 Tax=Pisum sativum TaxID=3888 RepID=UPI0021D1131D|nr:nuclear transcription factor Y subunit B-3-like [Pisum sativum]
MVLLSGKYLARNNFFRLFQVVIELDGRESNHDRVVSLREKGNKRKHDFFESLRGQASGRKELLLMISLRKTINVDDLVWAMTTLGFEEYTEHIKVYLNKYMEIEGDKNFSMNMIGGKEQQGGNTDHRFFQG